MIPVEFDYEAPTTVDEAVRLLAEAVAAGREVKVLAGGQSLLPVLRLRMSAPELVIDLSKVAELRGVSESSDGITIGAMTPHAVVASDPLVKQHALLLAVASQTVADPQVRHRGTFGGALAHADPAGDLPAPALALDAEFVLAGPGGRRTVAASEFFTDLFTTALAEDELLVAVNVPSYAGWGAHYEKFNRVSQAWSIVAAAVALRVEGGVIAQARVGLTNMGSVPVRATAVEQALVGASPDAASIRSACAAAGEGTTPPSDANAGADYRTHLAGVLTGRAVLAAAGV